MVRDVESAKDTRVNGFYPDKWQRQLLDIVDNKQSALVVAPTSSGKTFISYYCMKQVILKNKVTKKSTEKGYVIYVLPTKALVNQICADIFARYGPVYGTYYRGYNKKVLDCQVLVTVPERLEYLLLDPIHEQWCKQIRYIIFDEVHCIGQAENNGNIWERVLKLVSCPILALSATVGNPNQFYQWLKYVQEHYNNTIDLVIHPTRWSDLEKYFYLPLDTNYKERSTITDLRSYRLSQGTKTIVPIHPIVAINQDNPNQNELIPTTLALSPSDSLKLYDEMYNTLYNYTADDDHDDDDEVLLTTLKKSLTCLKPEIYFHNNVYISKRS